MTNLDFVLSLTPKQIFKFIEFNNKPEFTVGIILKPTNEYDTLCIKDNDFRMDYRYINNKWNEYVY